MATRKSSRFITNGKYYDACKENPKTEKEQHQKCVIKDSLDATITSVQSTNDTALVVNKVSVENG